MRVGLVIEGLTLARGARVLMRDFHAQVAPGETASLTGANGAGKTSLLRAIAGLVAPVAGRIGFQGPDGELDPQDARRHLVHLLGHQDGLESGRTAAEELDFQARWCGATVAGARAAADRLGLTKMLALPVRALSAGQRRRLALARLLASERPLWLLDEPLTPLDAAHRALLGEIMGEHVAGGGLILAAVHDPLPIAARTLAL